MPIAARQRKSEPHLLLLVAVGFPFVEAVEAKRRPGLVASAPRLHDAHGVYWLAMISSAQAGERVDDILVADHEKAGLPAKCAIRVARFAAVSDARMQRRIGAVSAKDRVAVSALLGQTKTRGAR